MEDDDNLPTTETKEKLISSYIELTAPSREEVEFILETHQWDLNAAVSAFNEYQDAVAAAAAAAAEANVPNPSDQQVLETGTHFSNLRIDIPVLSTPPTSPSLLRSESGVANPFSNQTNQRAGNNSDNGKDEERETLVLTLWKNGFTVYDGPVMTYKDPKNAKVIRAALHMKSPRDLTPHYRIELIKRYSETYPESPKPMKPFSGIARTLAGSDSVSTEPTAPTTSIQLRLADGTRIISRFNTHQTVRDVRDFIDRTRPGGSRDYQLLIMEFPPKPLTDLDQTIEESGISNSVIIQKY